MSGGLYRNSINCLRTVSSRSVSTGLPSSPASPPTKIDANYLSNSTVDVEKLFLSTKVRSLLKKLSGFDLNKIFAKRRRENTVPKYRLLTDEQLQEELSKAVRRGAYKMQMPPVMKRRQPSEKILRKDPELQGFTTSKYIFTDISFGYEERERPIVVREPNGVLRTCSWAERERMVQTYFTKPERELVTPRMFTEPHLTACLEKGWYQFVLDRACVQFEPDSESYLGVTQRVYEHLIESKQFESLNSTRHYGPMCLFYAVSKQGDALMLSLVESGKIDEASAFVKLLHLTHPSSRSAELVSKDSSPMDYIEAYVKLEAKHKAQLELALQSLQEHQAQATG